MFRRGLTLCLSASLWLAVAPAAQAASSGTLDQSMTASNGSVTANNRQMLAQTFTAGASGQLVSVSVMVGNGWGGSGDIDIQPVVAGKPVGPYPSAFQGPAWYNSFFRCCSFQNFALKPGISVVAGSQYAIVIVPHSGILTWSDYSYADKYPPGQGWMAQQSSNPSWFNLPSGGMDFAFQTFVATNSAPIVTVNADVVPVTEGAVPTNGGTFSDPNGAKITLSVTSQTGSAGTITPTGASTWSWTGVGADEGPGQTIVVTADDGLLKTTKSFTTTVGSVPPVAKISGAPASAPEGTTITLTGTAVSLSAEDNAAGFRYDWSATENGSALGTGTSGATYTFKINDESIYVVKLTATDDGGFSGHAEVTINGVDSTPSPAVTSVSQPFVIVPGEPLSFTGTFTDAGSTVDTSYTAVWTWGDGSPNMAGLTAPHAYSASGTFTATLTVTDDDGVAGSTTTQVIVLTPAQAIGRIAGAVKAQPGLNRGQMNSLLAKLNAATDAMERGNTGAACNQLGAFVNEIDADQKAGRLTAAAATTLTDAAQVTQRSIGCFRTLVEFLSNL